MNTYGKSEFNNKNRFFDIFKMKKYLYLKNNYYIRNQVITDLNGF